NILNECIESTLEQFYVDSGTYGLDYWEKMLGISKNTFDYQTRRENIKAKMRSRGNSTISLKKNRYKVNSNNKVDKIDNHSDYSFKIVFTGSLGVPVAFDELDKTINEIKPCHLAHSYEYSYLTWDNFEKYNHSWDEWDSKNL